MVENSQNQPFPGPNTKVQVLNAALILYQTKVLEHSPQDCMSR